jgi:cytochrome c peroxidase
LEQQVWAPFLARNEMANPSIGYVIDKIKAIPEYDGLFEKAFNGRGPTMETISMALACYQRTLNSANSPFDRWHFGNQEDAVSEQVKHGFKLFTGKAACNVCHLIHEDYALFADNLLHNTGLGYLASMGITTKTTRVQLAPGVFVDVDTEIIKRVSRPKENDLGRYEVTENPHDRWKFRTPPLRNVALTAPYMHDGSLQTLRDVIEFYNVGGVPNELLSPLIKPLNLTEEEIDALVAFLESLTGNNVAVLVADAFAAPIGDISQDDPNWAHEKKTN